MDKIKECIDKFDMYDNSYKERYFNFHLTTDDYIRISKNLIGFQNGKKNELDNYIYCPIFKKDNELNFFTIMYDKINNIFFKPYQPIMICDKCKNSWRINSLEKLKNSLLILCNDCLKKKNIILKRIKNIVGQNIIYKSNLELKFIKWCNKNNIIVYNNEISSFKINNININIHNNNEKYINDELILIINPKNWIDKLIFIKNIFNK